MTVGNVRYQETMAIGADRYDDALAVLARFGQAGFTQTGGMCAALEIVLERGYLLVTDVEDSLPWDRENLRGWGVGFYWSDDVCEGPEVFVDSEDTDPEALAGLVQQCLQDTADRIAREGSAVARR